MKWMHRLLVSVGLLQAALGGELRVVSYNIKHGQGMDGKIDLERVAAVIAQKKPHLVALQEVDKDCKRSGNRDIAAGEYGVAVLSKLPISGLHHYKLPGGPEPRTALEVQVTVKGHAESVSFVSVHNDWTSEEVRVGQVTALLDHLKERKHPVIIAGDFNGEMNDASMKLFGEKGWKVLDKKGVKTYPSDKPEIEIDFVVTRGLKAELLEHGAMEERLRARIIFVESGR